jgi:hypothetical protein
MRTLSITFVLCILANSLAANELNLRQQLIVDSAPLTTFALLPDVENSENSAVQKTVVNEKLEPKNRGKALFMSLLVPGWGQHYAGKTTKRNVFLGLEVGMWLTYGGLKAFSAWRQQDYEAYAATHAGVNLDGKNNTYFIDVGNFSSIYEHNDYRLQQRNFNKYYEDIDFNYWKWDSQANMDKFDQLRISADTADNRSLFVLGAIVANHIFSAIDAVWSVHRYEKARLSNVDWNIRFGDGLMQPNMRFSLTAHF